MEKENSWPDKLVDQSPANESRRNHNKELSDYYDNLSGESPLDKNKECELINKFATSNTEKLKTYVERFRLSIEGEQLFVQLAQTDLIMLYINKHSLRNETQKFIIDSNLEKVADCFVKMRYFWDVDYLIDNASDAVIRSHVLCHPLENDEQVLKIALHSNDSLFSAYMGKGNYVSDDVLLEIIEKGNVKAFKAVLYRFYREFKRKSKKKTYDELLNSHEVGLWLSEKVQLAVLDSGDTGRYGLIEEMLKTTPLMPSIQRLMFKRNFEAQYFKLHVSCLYGVGGYRFSSDCEDHLFKVLASKNLDECLLKYRVADDVNFVRIASSKTTEKYINDYWLSDDAQVALISRCEVGLIKAFIARFSSDHGMCWQAEVKLVEVCSPDVIKLYIAFHTMCAEAIERLRRKSQEAVDFYYSLHSY